MDGNDRINSCLFLFDFPVHSLSKPPPPTPFTNSNATQPSHLYGMAVMQKKEKSTFFGLNTNFYLSHPIHNIMFQVWRWTALKHPSSQLFFSTWHSQPVQDRLTSTKHGYPGLCVRLWPARSSSARICHSRAACCFPRVCVFHTRGVRSRGGSPAAGVWASAWRQSQEGRIFGRAWRDCSAPVFRRAGLLGFSSSWLQRQVSCRVI